MTSSSDDAMILGRDFTILGDDDHLAELVEYPGWEGAIGFAKTKPLKAPVPVYFAGNIDRLREIDFPENNVRWPIMSTRMLRILMSLGEFEHQAIPVVFVDDRRPLRSILRRGETPDARHTLEGFSAVQLLTQSDAFDWEQSKYAVSEYDPTLVDRLDFLRLTRSSAGFPPLFRLSAYPVHDLVSRAAVQALEDAGVVGTSFEPVGEYPSRP